MESDNNTFQMYHGGKRWSRIPTEFLGSAKNRYEAGPGIYLTNDYNTARSYAKGSRVVHTVGVDKNYKDIKDVKLPLTDVVGFVKSCRGMRRKKEVIESLTHNAQRMNKDYVTAEVLNNLVVNFEAGAGNAGIQIAKYFVSKGGDANLEMQAGGEYWLVVFNPSILKTVSVIDPRTVTSDFPYLLPKPGSQ